ncbi:MAG: SDR family oxidoreductase [Brachymonas sp.]|nr:SDR family oxidoreductase [Brachymonas sp.]
MKPSPAHPSAATAPHTDQAPSPAATPPTVLITGGARRLGAELCRAFAAAGWRVICHYQHSQAEAQALQQALQAQGATVELVQANLADADARRQMMQRIATQWGPLQALVNNASLFLPDTGHSYRETQALQQLAVNLLAPLDLARLMAQQHPADAVAACCAIHVLDQKVFNLNPDYFSYTTSKLALERAVALQAQALAPCARVCGVAPGLMYQSGPQQADNFKVASHANLLRRPIRPQDVAASCVFLAQTPAITGSTLCVDNGQHLLPLPRDILFVVDELLAPHLQAARDR